MIADNDPTLPNLRRPLLSVGLGLKGGFLFALLALSGCERDFDGRTKAMRQNDERLSILYDNQRFEERVKSSENCLKRGGIVVRSSWDGRIVDCK